jgi:hypothetical protein
VKAGELLASFSRCHLAAGHANVSITSKYLHVAVEEQAVGSACSGGRSVLQRFSRIIRTGFFESPISSMMFGN